MNLDNLRKEMEQRGIEGNEVTIIKNGIPCQGIRVVDPNGGNVCPVIYYSENETVEHFMERLTDCMSAAFPKFNENELTKWEYIRKNAFVGIRRKCHDKELIWRDYLNLELYVGVRIEVDGSEFSGSFKITKNLARMLGRSEEEIWDAAFHNSKDRYQVRNIIDMLGFPGESPMYVVTDVFNCNGASGLAFPNVFEKFCLEHEEESVYILPSSLEDLILIGGSVVKKDFPVEDLAMMVQSVNDEMVDPHIALDPVAYQYTLKDGIVRIAAVAE